MTNVRRKVLFALRATREGDRQVPEGAHPLASLNPDSRFHVALRDRPLPEGLGDGWGNELSASLRQRLERLPE